MLQIFHKDHYLKWFYHMSHHLLLKIHLKFFKIHCTRKCRVPAHRHQYHLLLYRLLSDLYWWRKICIEDNPSISLSLAWFKSSNCATVLDVLSETWKHLFILITQISFRKLILSDRKRSANKKIKQCLLSNSK